MWSNWTWCITAMVTIYLRFIYKIQHTVECYSYKQNTWASLELPDILKSWYHLICWGWTETCDSIYKTTVGSKLNKPTNFMQSPNPKSRKLKGHARILLYNKRQSDKCNKNGYQVEKRSAQTSTNSFQRLKPINIQPPLRHSLCLPSGLIGYDEPASIIPWQKRINYITSMLYCSINLKYVIRHPDYTDIVPKFCKKFR